MRGLAPQLIYPLILPPQESRTLDDGDKTPTRRFADLTCESIPFSGMLLLYEQRISHIKTMVYAPTLSAIFIFYASKTIQKRDYLRGQKTLCLLGQSAHCCRSYGYSLERKGARPAPADQEKLQIGRAHV